MTDALERIETLLDQVCAQLSRWAEGSTPKPRECRHVWEIASRARIETRALRGEPTRDAIPEAMRRQVLARDGTQCRRCGDPADCVDHIIPVARYGPTTLDNLQAMCGPCNRAKGATL